jgi:hypothetical protein
MVVHPDLTTAGSNKFAWVNTVGAAGGAQKGGEE